MPAIPREGIVLIDKPTGISSFGAVAKLRRLTGVRKIGHAGTLDPMASGLLICLIGKKYTVQADAFLKLDKEYEVELTLGDVSASGDSEGPITHLSDDKPTRAEILKVLNQFKGTIEQVPPLHSAVKIGGHRAYALARAGRTAKLEPRMVCIYAITNVRYRYPKLRFTTKVSSGTYIRALGADIGERLGSGAYVSALRRTKIGTYSIEQAINLEFLA